MPGPEAILGAPSDNGQADVAYRLAAQEACRSQGWPVGEAKILSGKREPPARKWRNGSDKVWHWRLWEGLRIYI